MKVLGTCFVLRGWDYCPHGLCPWGWSDRRENTVATALHGLQVPVAVGDKQQSRDASHWGQRADIHTPAYSTLGSACRHRHTSFFHTGVSVQTPTHQLFPHWGQRADTDTPALSLHWGQRADTDTPALSLHWGQRAKIDTTALSSVITSVRGEQHGCREKADWGNHDVPTYIQTSPAQFNLSWPSLLVLSLALLIKLVTQR